ncbi:DotU family type IV/VI secretion system protein [Pseudomonas putida]|uniref:DotU family type IV/VI secretion system protein n=1 Tax=Pseudomonas putida TaxID=303 RepID=A0A2Z4RC58_PSEPU|nr:type VI secretion system protein TssL, short form [Pseudomonas putida]AWY38567.1 DotU family type IV/VI secretion system protein [Pseudomonas putida]
MNPIPSKKHQACALAVDSLLQDSYLLVVELRQKASIDSSQPFIDLCTRQVEYVRQRLEQAGLNPRSIDHISHAQCALLDETVLGCAEERDHAKWASEPLQAKFFNRHQAGEFLYEDMREVLREPAPDLHVLTAFHRVLMLGFQGRYRDINDPERELLLTELSARVAPLSLGQTIATQVTAGSRRATLPGLQSPLAQVLAVVLLLGATWWGLDHLLAGWVATLVPEV